MLESKYQSDLKKKISERLPNAIILKNDPTYCQGFPDLLILQGDRYAVLEVKRSSKEKHQPNQDYYVERLHKEGNYASFIFPENEEEVLNELERALKS